MEHKVWISSKDALAEIRDATDELIEYARLNVENKTKANKELKRVIDVLAQAKFYIEMRQRFNNREGKREYEKWYFQKMVSEFIQMNMILSFHK